MSQDVRFYKLVTPSPMANTGSQKLDALEALSPALRHDHGNLKPASAALVASGAGCLSYGTTRYFASMRLLQRGLFRPNVVGIALVAATSGMVAGGGIVMVVKQEKAVEVI
ncbi:hypothetical protein B0O99DRAFT_610416 [Bisporella sp. PMI_857]|nr:hypothetical protein B0O99DRAFT_610416 [Bisporella sp. PMI_857]